MLPHTDIGTRGNFSIQCAGQFSDLVRVDTSLPNFPYLDDEVLDARRASPELGLVYRSHKQSVRFMARSIGAERLSGKNMMLNLSR